MAAAGAGIVGGNSNSNNAERWYFSATELANSPSRASGMDHDKELSCRQITANLIQEMGQRLHVNQLCINTAIVYMHRFYRFHSFTKFNRNDISQCALFLAAKVEEQPRKLEHVIKCARAVIHKGHPPVDPQSDEYMTLSAELVSNENLMLQTLGFDIGIDHPHTHVVKCCQLVKASKELAQTSYFLATNTLHFTTMCLQYKPTVVACLCIHLACKWTNWQIPPSYENKEWFSYIDETVTQSLLEELVSGFLDCLDKCPEKMRNRIFSCIKSKDAMQNVPGQTSTGGTSSSGSRNHQSQSLTSLTSQTHRSDTNALSNSAQRSSSSSVGTAAIDSNRNSRVGHPHQPDSTTLLADRRKTMPPSLQQQQQPQQGHNSRPPGNHHGHSSAMVPDRYAYNKEHQRQTTTPSMPNVGNNSSNRHSLPPNMKTTTSTGMMHPKKQYQQYLGGQQHLQQQQPQQQQIQPQQSFMPDNKMRDRNPPPPPTLVDQSRREQHMKIDQQQHGLQINTQPPKLEIKQQQGIRTGLEDTSGLLKAADFSQPYPSCQSPKAQHPMFEGDSNSMDMDFMAGLNNLVTQTSPNTNSGSNSMGFGGSSSQKKQLSPPETHHHLSPPQAFLPSSFGLTNPVSHSKIEQKPAGPMFVPKQEDIRLSTTQAVPVPPPPALVPQVKQEPLLTSSANLYQQQHPQLQVHSQPQQPQLLEQPQQQQQIQQQKNVMGLHRDMEPKQHQQQQQQQQLQPQSVLKPAVVNEITSLHQPTLQQLQQPPLQVPNQDYSAKPMVSDFAPTAKLAPQMPQTESRHIEPEHAAHSGIEQPQQHMELDGGKKHKKKKEKKEKKEKRHKDEKKKKKKKDKDRSPSRSCSGSPPGPAAAPVVQLDTVGVKLKIKLIPPKQPLVGGSDSDSNAGTSNDHLPRIKIPLDKSDNGEREKKRKRKDDHGEETGYSKSRKLH